MADSGTITLPPVAATEPGADINTPTGTSGLFVVCKSDAFVEFYDAKSFARAEEINLPDFPHEVVLSPDRKTAYVSIYGNGQVGTNTKPGTKIAVIDLAARKLSGFIEIAPYLAPHGLMFDRAGHLWATAELSNGIVVIDPVRGVVLDAVLLGSHRTHFFAATPDGSKIYVPHRQLKFMSVVDVATRREVKRIANFAYECQGVAVAPDGNRVYQASSARPLVTVIDPRTDEVAGSVMVEGMGDFPPQLTRLKVSPDNRFLVVSYNVSRKAAVLDTRDLRHQVLFDLEKSPMGIAFPDCRRAFVTNHDGGSISVIDLDTMKLDGRIATHMGAETMAFY
ncbi:MAG TPA: YncE family protein [Stellaceae bacterium]|nr:YncE family protein [Stellaceae bacterium]